MRKLYLDIQVRDSLGKLYKRESGEIVYSFRLEIFDLGDSVTKSQCKETFENFKAVSKEGSQVHIDVMYYDSISDIYPVIYSFYGAENKFVKH